MTTFREFLAVIQKEFGDDIEFRVKMNNGSVIKSKGWKRSGGFYDKFHAQQKQQGKLDYKNKGSR